ncbi:MAG TPA: GAF domain-containing protein, partial [Methanocellaceae archaeon]
KVSQCIGGTAVVEKRPIAFEDFTKCPESAMGKRIFQNAASVVFVPIMFQGRALGVMDLASKKHRRFTEEDIRLFSSIANTIGAAVNDANYVEYVKAQAKKFSLLFKTSAMLSSTMDLKKILSGFAKNAAEASGSNVCEIFFIDENTGMLHGVSAYGLDENVAKKDSLKPAGAVGEAIATKQARIVHDASEDQSLPPRFAERRHIRSFLCMPLVNRDVVTGIIILFTKGETKVFSSQAIETTAIISGHAAQAIDNARLVDSMRKRNDELKRVYEIQRRITQSIDLEETMESIVESAPHITKLPYCVIFLMDSSNEQIISVKATESVAAKFGKLTFNMRDLIASRIAMKERRPLFIEDAPHFKDIAKQVVKLLDMRSVVVLPLIARDRVLGIMWLYGTEGNVHFDSDDVRSAVALSDQAAIKLDNARLFKELEDSYEKLKDLDNMKMEFFTLISHELRNPMAIIKGFSELLYEGVLGPVNEMQKERLMKIRESVDKLADMVGKMSDISTLETRHYPIDRMPTSLNELVNGVVHGVEFIAKSKQVDLHVDVPMGLPLIPLDRVKMEQVLLNLINNAIKYTPSGGQIFVDAVDRDRDIMVSIKDTGIGIPKKDLDKIFTGFYHAGYKLSYEYKGPGLGLAISKKIVEGHGGHIWAESEEGKGSTLFFTLPKNIPEDLTVWSEAKSQSD